MITLAQGLTRAERAACRKPAKKQQEFTFQAPFRGLSLNSDVSGVPIGRIQFVSFLLNCLELVMGQVLRRLSIPFIINWMQDCQPWHGACTFLGAWYQISRCFRQKSLL
jgi:hypothetical protein